MFTYDLEQHKTISGFPLGDSENSPIPTDAVQQSGDAVVLIIPFAVEDTFSFEGGESSFLAIEGGKTTNINVDPSIDEMMKTGGGFLLDSQIINLSVQHSKTQYTGSLSAMLVDPNHNLLSMLNPGDWVFCWMFDRHEGAVKLRKELSKGFSKQNAFSSGLKFVGKVYSTRLRKTVTPDGSVMKQIALNATSFSELGSHIYYDPLLTHNFGNLEFIQNVNEAVNSEFSGEAKNISKMTAALLSAFLGNPPKMSTGPNYNAPLRIPQEAGTLLGKPRAKAFLDILHTYIGVQKYSIGIYTPDMAEVTNPSTPTVLHTPYELLGYAYPFIAPFHDVPIWSAVQQNSVPLLNEMYTTLRCNDSGEILPTAMIRQIPFNTEAFVKKGEVKATAFRELPRWKVTDKSITSYDTGKSGAMRINFVQIQPSSAFSNKKDIEALMRSQIDPMWDNTDIQRNGLFPFISQIYSTDTVETLKLGRGWNAMVTDRMMGGHLKLSGSMGLAGVQEPIAVGDNLEYDGMLYHIEAVTHTLSINPQAGFKSFSTQLALSHGVPATGNVLPEVPTRSFKMVSSILDLTAEPTIAVSKTTTAAHSRTPPTNIHIEGLNG